MFDSPTITDPFPLTPVGDELVLSVSNGIDCNPPAAVHQKPPPPPNGWVNPIIVDPSALNPVQ